MRGAVVVREDGLRGTVVENEDHGRVIVQFDDDSRIIVASETLILQPDGSYRVSEARASESGEIVIPVVAEELTIETHRVVRGKVRINKRVETREELVETPVVSEQFVVERVPVNKYIEDVPPQPRDEDGVLIIPLIEEVLVVEKRLLLREEVRVSRRRTTSTTPQKVVLRREVVDVDRGEVKETRPEGEQDVYTTQE